MKKNNTMEYMRNGYDCDYKEKRNKEMLVWITRKRITRWKTKRRLGIDIKMDCK